MDRRRVGQGRAQPRRKQPRPGARDRAVEGGNQAAVARAAKRFHQLKIAPCGRVDDHGAARRFHLRRRSEEPTSELQSLMRISYAVFCLTQKTNTTATTPTEHTTQLQSLIQITTTFIFNKTTT